MRRFKTKKKRKYIIFKVILLAIISYLSFALTFDYFFKNFITKRLDNEQFVKYLTRQSTNGIVFTNSNLLEVLDLKINSPRFLLERSLNNVISVDEAVFYNVEDEKYEYEKLEKKSQHFEDPNPINVNKPIVYIYNTHQLENYAATYLADYNIQPNVLMASYILKEKLNSLNIPTIVESNNITEILRVNNWNYAYSYKASRFFIDDVLEKNKELEYLIDIHRDSAKKDKTTLVIDGVNYARVMFVVGVEHQNYESNLKLANSLNELIKKEHPQFTRGVLKKGGKGVNGVYNQDAHRGAILIEIGGVDNTIDEVANTVNMLAKILFNYIRGIYEK